MRVLEYPHASTGVPPREYWSIPKGVRECSLRVRECSLRVRGRIAGSCIQNSRFVCTARR